MAKSLKLAPGHHELVHCRPMLVQLPPKFSKESPEVRALFAAQAAIGHDWGIERGFLRNGEHCLEVGIWCPSSGPITRDNLNILHRDLCLGVVVVKIRTPTAIDVLGVLVKETIVPPEVFSLLTGLTTERADWQARALEAEQKILAMSLQILGQEAMIEELGTKLTKVNNKLRAKRRARPA